MGKLNGWKRGKTGGEEEGRGVQYMGVTVATGWSISNGGDF